MARKSVFGGKVAGARLERMLASAHFVDGAFRNTSSVSSGLKKGTAMSTFGEFVFGGKDRFPPAPLLAQNPLPGWSKGSDTGLRTTWLGHSTVMLEIDGARVLTDPVWGQRASPFSWAGPKRFQPVPVAIEALPHLDAVIVSHDHYDHLDYGTILALAKRDVPFYTALGVGAHLEAWGVPEHRIIELDWWQSADVPGVDLQITATPSQHFSGRGFERNRTLWAGFAMQSPDHRVFFSGDTGLTEEYREIRDKLGPFDLTMLEIGAWHPSWGDIHLGPGAALEANAMLGGGMLLPVHWGTFSLGLHAWDEPAETLVREATARDMRLLMPRLGQPVEPAQYDGPTGWWRKPGSESASVEAPAPV